MRLPALALVLACAAAAHAGRATLETEFGGDAVNLHFRPLSKGTVRATLIGTVRVPLLFELVDPDGRVRAAHKGLVTAYTLESACDPVSQPGHWGVRVSEVEAAPRLLIGPGSISLSVRFPTAEAGVLLTVADVAALAGARAPEERYRPQLEPLVVLLRAGDTAPAARELAAIVQRASGAGERAEFAGWLRWVLREAFLSKSSDLLAAARNFRGAAEAEATLLAEARRIEKLMAELRAGMRTSVQLLDLETLGPGDKVLAGAKELRAYHERTRDALEAQQAQLILARVRLERRMEGAREPLAGLARARTELRRAAGLKVPD